MTNRIGGYGKALLGAASMILLGSSLCGQSGPSTCTYVLDYTSLSVPAAGGSRTIGVTTGLGCGWSASTDAPWINVTSGASGTGTGTIGFNLVSNPTTSSRTGHLTVQGQMVAITEVALLGPVAQVQQVWMARSPAANQVNNSSCTTAPAAVTTFSPTDVAAYVFLYATQVNTGDVISTQYFAPDGTLYAGAGSSYTVAPEVQSVCVEDQGMKIVGAPPASKPGLWTAKVNVNGVLMITASFTINGASACSYTLSANSLSLPPGGGTGFTTGIVTTSNCGWAVVNNTPWIAITANSSGTGSGAFVYTVAPNPGDSRIATLSISGQILTITQIATGGPTIQAGPIWMTGIPFANSITPCSAASAPVTTFAPTDAAAYLYLGVANASVGDFITDQYYAPDGTLYANAGGNVTVSSPSAQFMCWEDPGMVIRNAPAANMIGTWTVKVQVNGVLVITTSFTMTGGSNCSYPFSPAAGSFGANGGTGTVAVSADPGCSWTASTGATWIHVTLGSTGTGTAPVAYTVDVNSGAARSATIVIAGQPYTVSEASGLPGLPTITPSGVADPWTYTQGVAPGAWISIYGTNLANATQSWSPTPGQSFATTLAGVSVMVDGIAAAPSYVSPTLVNVLAPSGIRTGPVQIVVTNNGLAGLPFTVQSTQFLPAIYSNAAPGTTPARYYVTAIDPLTNQLIGNLSADPRVTRAPRAGDTIDLYALGLGPATTFSTTTDFTGAFATTSPVSVVVGGVAVTPSFSDLVAPGLYQMRIVVPATLASGDQPILLNMGGGVQSAANVFLSIQR